MEKSMFYSDKPIISDKEDLLNRRNFAKLLANSLMKLNNQDTFTIGLFGRWGHGKTSLVNMMLHIIEDYQKENEELIIVRFEPWNFSNTNQLLEQFFVRLSNTLRSTKDKKMAKIGDALDRYSDAFELAELIPVAGGAIAFAGKKGVSSFGKNLKKGSDEKDIQKQKENIIGLLEKQKKRILIVIDDIDRLGNEQIRQVFQLITSVAKFPNITYLLVFDKEIVVKALEKVQEGSGEEYLEKIVQMPIQIPDIQPNELRQVLLKKIERIIANQNDVHFKIEHWRKLFESCISPMINNLRDANRLCNSIQFKLLALSSEVDFADLVAISAVEIAHPSVYEWIKNNKSILTGQWDVSQLEMRERGQKEWYDLYQAQINSALSLNKEEQIKNKLMDSIMTFLAQLFPYFGRKIGEFYEVYDWNSIRRNNQIAHPEKFDRYFNLNIDYINVKKTEIQKAVYTMDAGEFGQYLLDLDKDDLSYEFLEEVTAMISEITEDRVRVIIKALISTAYLLDTVSTKSFLMSSARSYAEYMVLNLFGKIRETERIDFFMELVNNVDINSISSLAEVIYMVELGYGRLDANGEERKHNQIITMEELLRLEDTFINKIKKILEKNSLFDFFNYRIILYLLENIVSDYIQERIKKELQDDKNILKYLQSTVGTWTGSGVRYEVTDDYKKYLSQEQILEAIQSEVRKKTLFTLPEKIQNLCAAFYLKSKGNEGYDGYIAQFDVSNILVSWKECEEV